MRAQVTSLTLGVVVALAGCNVKPPTEGDKSGGGKDAGGTSNAGSDASKPTQQDAGLDQTSGTKVSVSGLVLDVLGNRVSAADVQLGQRAAKSGEDGEFSFGLIPLAEEATLIVTHAGFSKGRVVFKPLAGVDNYLKLTLQPTEKVMLQDPSQGGDVQTASGAVLSVPPNAVVDQDGNLVTGPVEVSVALINDRDEMAAAPRMTAIDPAAANNDAPAELESFGMVSVDLTSNGMPVQLAAGATVEVKFPMAAGAKFDADSPVGLWHFDEDQQVWMSDGEGTVDADNMFHAFVSHFSWWNADQVMTKTCIHSSVLDAQGHPIAGANIISEGRSYLGSTHTATDMQGNFCVDVRVSSVVQLSALVHVGDQSQALAVRVNTPRTMATCARPSDCYELPAPLVAVANMPLCQPSTCPQDPAGVKQACCLTDLGPCNFVVHGDCGGSEDGAWDMPSDTPGVMQIPGVPMSAPPDAGVDSGTQMSLPDAAVDAGMDSGSQTPDSGSQTPDSGSQTPDSGPVCGPFYQSACKQCIAANCDSQANTCLGQQWQAGSFTAPCQAFGQCLCDSPTADPQGCDPKQQNQLCGACLQQLSSCLDTSCSVQCGGGGNNGGGGGDAGTNQDGGTHGTVVERCSGLIPLSTFATVEGTTVGSTLASDWWDTGDCELILPNHGYLPGFERSYSISVPVSVTLRTRVMGAGMMVMIAEDCSDLSNSCKAAGNTAAYHNTTQAPRTVYVTVDNSRVDAQAPFSLSFSTATPSCGDGFVDAQEACDDGGTSAGDGCSASCQLEQGWSCPGDRACYQVVCGDGIRETGVHSTVFEPCDDGNSMSGDGCSSSCQVEQYYVCEQPNTPCRHTVCGDNVVDYQYEHCDDGNATPGDGCGASCQIEDGWTCPKNGGACTRTVCGDGMFGPGEDCDDGNVISGDGCDNLCHREVGWNCPQAGQSCHHVVCGDGIVDSPFEDCDDSNTAAGDGCSPSCGIETGYVCDTRGSNCAQRPAGDLCSNAQALPTGKFSDAFTMTGMSPDQINCNGCPVTRWFSAVQQPGEITTVWVDADFMGYLAFAPGVCPGQSGSGAQGGIGFSPGYLGVEGLRNDTDAVRTLYFALAAPSATGNFELTVKTGPPGCGDGTHAGYDAGPQQEGPYESCDDMNTVGGDGCSASCQVEPGYHCAWQGGPCAHAVCGDGIVDWANGGGQDYVDPSWGETCDDGNTVSGDGCSANCRVEAGAVCTTNNMTSQCVLTQAGDTCSNALALPLGSSSHSLDGFSSSCQYQEMCGPDMWFMQVLQPREQLSVQVSALFAGQASLQAMTAVSCQNNFYGPVGGNATNFSDKQDAQLSMRNDGNHPLSVMLNVGALGAISGSFSLQASVAIPTQTCAPEPCTPGVCGDGQQHDSEQCDDGNTTSGDGCSATCVRESGYGCQGNDPSTCAPLSPGDGCEVAAALVDGSYDFAGFGTDNTCDVSCQDPVRWFQITVPASETLTFWLTSADMNGQARLFDTSRGSCSDLQNARLYTLPFSPSLPGYGGWINLTGAPASLLLAVADKSGESPHFTLAHRLAPTGCGDSWTDTPGYFGAPEQCDDGNTQSADGCSATCTTESGWDCRAGRCAPIVCGDGVVSSTEGCDDNNLAAGDGCSATCTVEDGYLCGGTPSLCRATQAGDQCETALPLIDDTYSLTGYVPDLSCSNVCDGPDRWFDVSVPPGNTFSLFASSQMDAGSLYVFQAGSSCNRDQLNQVRSFPLNAQQGSVGLSWPNYGPTTLDFKVVVADSTDPSNASFTLTHAVVPSGCGDFMVDSEGQHGMPEQCDDGNAQSGDGCSSTCQVESGYQCFGTPQHCMIPPPGDSCDTAQTLSAGNYSLSGYLPDPQCQQCATDRWLRITVPPNMLLDLDLATNAQFGAAQLYARNSGDCSALQSLQNWFPNSEPQALRWVNTNSDAVSLVLELLDQARPSSAEFQISYRIVPAGCGDSFIDWSGQFGPSENCDDGNQVSGDGCSSTCQGESGQYCQGEPSVCTTHCGDYQTAGTEACDDGNQTPGDGCSSTCTAEPGFDCSAHSYCVPICGDGLVRGYEQCDDGNAMPGDGCSAVCSQEFGWSCNGQPSVCATTCGDGIQAGAEQCDDHNTVSGDGCSATCTSE